MVRSGWKRAASGRGLAALLWLLASPPTLALDLPQPWAPAVHDETGRGSYRLPTAAWTEAGLPVQVIEGNLTRGAWQRPLDGASTLDLMAPLRAALRAEGFRKLFECETEDCGGFDFRFATDVLAEPAMHVDLGDFRFLSALRDTPRGPEALSLLVSRSAATGFVQVVRVTPAPPPTAAPQVSASTKSAAPRPEPDQDAAQAPGLIARLEGDGGAVLEGLVFASGSAALEDRAYPELGTLGAWLRDDPKRRVVLVGHTDASGSLSANVEVSRARAAAVRDRLIDRHGASPAQVAAEGAGYLAPRASNLSDEGRARNRRVEVTLLPPG